MLLYNPYTHDSRVFKEGQSLLASGASVRIVAKAGGRTPAREIVDGCEVVRLPYDPPPARIVRAGVAAARRVRRRRVVAADGEPLPLPPRPAPPGAVAARVHAMELAARRVLVCVTYFHWYRRAVREALREPVDLMVAHDLETLPAAWLAARRLRARLLYDAHELATEQRQIVERTRLGTWRAHKVEALLARRADGVVTINESLADELVARCRVPRPTVVRNVPYAQEPVTPDRRWLTALGVPGQASVVIYVGGLVEHRGLEDLIVAMRSVADAWLVYMGPAEAHYVNRLTELARRAEIAERFRIALPVPSPEVAAHAAAADVGVIPFRRSSLNHWLSLPNKLFEYLAGGLPIVTVAFPELEQIVRGYDVGRVCPPEDVEQLAEAIRSVLDSPTEAARLRRNVARAAAELTWEREEPRYLAAMARAAGRSA
jgi:glycosyltransferase involved in cell wall biosynthesis